MSSPSLLTLSITSHSTVDPVTWFQCKLQRSTYPLILRTNLWLEVKPLHYFITASIHHSPLKGKSSNSVSRQRELWLESPRCCSTKVDFDHVSLQILNRLYILLHHDGQGKRLLGGFHFFKLRQCDSEWVFVAVASWSLVFPTLSLQDKIQFSFTRMRVK